MRHTYGMAIMEHRTSFALDEQTILRLRKLAGIWRVSQAEAVRRAIEKAERDAETDANSLANRLREYHAQGGLAADKAETYLEAVAQDRADWGRGQ
jgi:hypothetical protein